MVLDKQEKQKEPTQEIIKVILELFNSNKLWGGILVAMMGSLWFQYPIF